MVKREVDYDEIIDIIKDMAGIEELLTNLETSEYFNLNENDSLVFRAVRNSLGYTKYKLEKLIECSNEKI